MKNVFKIFSLITLIFAFFSCEQHYFYLKKVTVNSETSKVKPIDKIFHHSEMANFTYTYKDSDSNKILNENIFASSETSNFDFLNSIVDTPKPYIIKKLPAVEEENYTVKKQVESSNIQKPNEKKFPAKIFLGILMMMAGAALFMFSYTYTHSSNNGYYSDQACYNGCGVLLLSFIGIGSFVSGFVIFIMGLIHSF